MRRYSVSLTVVVEIEDVDDTLSEGGARAQAIKFVREKEGDQIDGLYFTHVESVDATEVNEVEW